MLADPATFNARAGTMFEEAMRGVDEFVGQAELVEGFYKRVRLEIEDKLTGKPSNDFGQRIKPYALPFLLENIVPEIASKQVQDHLARAYSERLGVIIGFNEQIMNL